MYEVIARTFDGHKFDENYISAEYARCSFEVAQTCVDCESVLMIDALTGEILDMWNKYPSR